MKILSTAALEALDKGEAIVAGAIKIACDPPVLAWGGNHVMILEGEEFLPLGDRALVQVAAGALGGAAQNITLSLSGIDAETLELLDASEVSGAPTILWRLIFNQAGDTLLDYHVWARGRLDTLDQDEEIGGTATLIGRLETGARGLGRRGARMRSDADQRLIDPADGFFKNVSYAAEKMLYWGGRRPSRAGSVLGEQDGGQGGGRGTDTPTKRFAY